jgi:hypothetical protein
MLPLANLQLNIEVGEEILQLWESHRGQSCTATFCCFGGLLSRALCVDAHPTSAFSVTVAFLAVFTLVGDIACVDAHVRVAMERERIVFMANTVW